MNEALKMQISAFVDGELPDNESELLLRRLSQDAAMRQQVAEYLEIGRLIRRDQELAGMERLRGSVAAALGDEIQPEPAVKQAVGSSLMTPASGIAVAAIVAAVALLGLGQLTTPVDSGLQDDAVVIDLAPAYTEPSVADVIGNMPSARELDLLRRHNDGDILYRMATFEYNERLEVIEPDGHLTGTAETPAPQDASAEEESTGTE